MGAFGIAAELFACSDMCQFLSAFLRLPDNRLVSAIEEGAIAEDVEAICADLTSLPETGLARGDCFSDFDAGSEGGAMLSSLRRDFTRMFAHPDAPSVPIYESQYLRGENLSYVLPLVVNPIAVDAERFYKRAGLVQPEGVNDSCDHMAMELGYLQCEYAAWGRAVEVDNREDASLHRGAVLSFDGAHTSRWACDFFEGVESMAHTKVFRGVGALGKVFFARYPSCLV